MKAAIYPGRLFLNLIIMVFAASLTGCTSTEVSDSIAALQAALASLQANRALTEQFVRDVKASIDPGDPAYAQVMDSYQTARETYDRFLDGVEDGGKTTYSRSLRHVAPIDVQNAAADFLADATSALKPNLNTRRIPFQRAVVVPTDLGPALKRLPKKAREHIIDQFDQQVRWRQWAQL
jgi:hypothetical protein